jgi:hypothetical protein
VGTSRAGGKGLARIADLQLPISDWKSVHSAIGIGNWQSPVHLPTTKLPILLETEAIGL